MRDSTASMCVAPTLRKACKANWQVGSPQLHRNCMKPPLLMSASIRHSATSSWSTRDRRSSCHSAAANLAMACS
ncbi:hypothetical protein G6F60_015366 [Rhizopus arrhizus]|nr:hypothetical protein G6F60_015366 [Rhizopus arrhizus]